MDKGSQKSIQEYEAGATVSTHWVRFHSTRYQQEEKNALHQNWSQSTSGRVLDELTYQRHKTALVRDHERKKTSTESTLIMMRETAANRRQWIQEERPTVTVIIKEFPYLKDPPVVSF